MGPSNGNKVAETDSVSVDEEDIVVDHTQQQQQPAENENENENGQSVSAMKTDSHGILKPSQSDQRAEIIQPRHPKTIRNIMMVLKEEKARENGSPMRVVNRGRTTTTSSGVPTQKNNNNETPSKIPKLGDIAHSSKTNVNTPSKLASDSAKTTPPKHHQVTYSLSLFYQV